MIYQTKRKQELLIDESICFSTVAVIITNCFLYFSFAYFCTLFKVFWWNYTVLFTSVQIALFIFVIIICKEFNLFYYTIFVPTGKPGPVPSESYFSSTASKQRFLFIYLFFTIFFFFENLLLFGFIYDRHCYILTIKGLLLLLN